MKTINITNESVFVIVFVCCFRNQGSGIAYILFIILSYQASNKLANSEFSITDQRFDFD